MEIFYQQGPAIVHEIKEQGHDIFLDLKLHDIPNTVKRAMTGLAKLGCDLVYVHAAGGREMMEAALEGLDAGTSMGAKRPNCIAVTQLTSTSEEQMRNEQLIQVSLIESVLHYARTDKQKSTGCRLFVHHMKQKESVSHLVREFLTVTPEFVCRMMQLVIKKRTGISEFAKEGWSVCYCSRTIDYSFSGSGSKLSKVLYTSMGGSVNQ